MDETFDIPVTYKNKELAFKGKLLQLGYTHKIEVEIDGDKLLFEPDEERNYRATIELSKINDAKKIDIDLLKVVANAIEKIVR